MCELGCAVNLGQGGLFQKGTVAWCRLEYFFFNLHQILFFYFAYPNHILDVFTITLAISKHTLVMDRRILPAAGAAYGMNSANSPTNGDQTPNETGENDAGGVGNGKRRGKKDAEDGGDGDEDGAKKKKAKRRKVDHACVYCRWVVCAFCMLHD